MGKVQQQHNIGADQADRWRKNTRKRRRGIWRLEYLFALILVPVAVILSQNPDIIGAAPSLMQLSDGAAETTPSSSLLSSGIGCTIKGNISINTGERIYHVPGQEHYWETRISPQYGERWFCTEEEARAAGWRKARR
ncbi:sunset domain-containing protein [Mesorhizobium sp. 43Arga]